MGSASEGGKLSMRSYRGEKDDIGKGELEAARGGDHPEIVEKNLMAEGAGTWYHAGFHLVCIIAGAGTLAFPSTMAYMGWGPGMVAWTLIAIAAYYASCIISIVVDTVSKRDGLRYFRYRDICVREYGPVWGIVAIVPWQFLNVVGISIALMIGAGQALQGIQTSFAYYNQPGQTQEFFAYYEMYDFFNGNNYYTNPATNQTVEDTYNWATKTPIPLYAYIIISSAVWFLMALIPTFHELRFLSLLALIMSIVFCSIIIGLSFEQGRLKYVAQRDLDVSETSWQQTIDAHFLENTTTFTDTVKATHIQNVFGVAVGLATISFAYGNCILPEVMGTVQEPALANMIKAYGLEFAVVLPLYFLVTISGYWAFGFTVNSFVLAQFSPSLPGQPSYCPLWTLVLANLAVFIQAVPSVQVYCQVLYDVFDPYVCDFELGVWHPRNVAGRCFVRGVYIALITFISALLPFFANFLGLIGSASVCPAVYIVPCFLHLKSCKPTMRSWMFWMDLIIIVCFTFIAFFGAAGSIWAISKSAADFEVFTSNPTGSGTALGH